MEKTILIPNSFYGPIVPAVFRQRLHRFAARVETEEGVEEVHIPNSGRLRELLFPGNQVGLHFEGRNGRKTRYTLVNAQTPSGWAYIDSRLPNRILAKHWRDFPELGGYEKAYPEKVSGASRFDLALYRGEPPEITFLEAKCVTLVREETGLFPDAPTERGRKHLHELAQLAREGRRSMVFFFLQHPAGRKAGANTATDPEFAIAMAEAIKAGVEFYAYRVFPGEKWVELTRVPVEGTVDGKVRRGLKPTAKSEKRSKAR